VTGLADRKSRARRVAYARRKAAHADAGIGAAPGIAPGAAGRLSEVLAGYRGVSLAGYMPIRTEIDPLPAMAEAAAHGVVGVPVIQGTGLALKFSCWEPEAAMKEGPFGAKVPVRDDWIAPEILIVPLVAFDLNGGRLGYGGGFYDRTLASLRATRPTLAVGFAYDAQQADELPLEPTDQPLDMLVTETRVLDFQT